MLQKPKIEHQESQELDPLLRHCFGPPQDRMASGESLAPSSGFVAGVMDRVRDEAAAAPALAPIRFPWWRAVPGLVLAVSVLLLCLGILVRVGRGVAEYTVLWAEKHGGSLRPEQTFAGTGEMLARLHLDWIAAAVVLSLLPLLMSRMLGNREHQE